MLNADHGRAQALAYEADHELRHGDRARALELYAEAADAESVALREISPDKRRTWGAVAVGVVALLYKARRLKEAEYRLYEFLSNRQLSDDARAQLDDLLTSVRDEQVLPSGYEYSGRAFELSLKEGTVGQGTAPVDVVLDESNRFRGLLVRAYELHAGLPLRRTNIPPPEVIDSIQFRATEGRTGSYRFKVLLAAPPQLSLFSRPIDPESLMQWVFSFIEAATTDGPAGAEQRHAMVPDDDYRRLLLKLVRNVIPTGKRVGKVEVGLLQDGAASVPPKRVVLSRDTRVIVNEALKQDRPQLEPERSDSITGVLRAVELDADWLRVDTRDGAITCANATDNVDDLIGPMVNHRVVVTGEWRTVRGSRRFYMQDIQLAEE